MNPKGIFQTVPSMIQKTLPKRKIIADNVFESFEDAIGNTPLIKLKRASELTKCNIYGKAEFMNPGGSVKDRAALWLIKQAEEQGKLVPGQPGIIVEGTAGNTGIGLALVAGCRGYRTIIVIPETQTQEKKDMLRLAGAELIEAPALPYKNPNTYIKLSQRIAENLGAVWANQFDNPQNKQSHVESTGPEIWAQTKGKIDGFSCAVGSGGTLAGVSEYLKSQNPNVKIALTDPQGAALYNYYKEGLLKAQGSSQTEGIGQGRITQNLVGFKPDYQYEITDAEALEVNYDLLKYEGLCLGSSSGINVAGAIEFAKKLGPGHTIVTVLCDYGTKYQKKMFNPPFLREQNLPVPEWIEQKELKSDVQEAIQKATLPKEIVEKEIKIFEDKKAQELKEWQEKQQKKRDQKYDKNIPSRGSVTHYQAHSFANRTTSQNNKEQVTFRSISIEDFEIIKAIGRGAFGKVLLVRDKKTDEIYAMKTIIKENIGDTDKNYNLQERQILTHMNSEFIIKLYFAFQDPFKLYMVLDFMDCGDLYRHLQRRGRFSEAEVCFIMCEVILGLEHLHKKGIVYRDLKPHNILIQADGHIKLADFGISKIEYSENDKAQTFCGTYQYMAPEIYKGKGYGQQADWYSFGITMYELLTGKTPFDDTQDLDQEQQKEVKQRGVHIQEDFSSELQFLLQQLIDPNPESRLGKAKIIKQDPYFMNIDWKNMMQKKTEPVYQPQNNMEGSQLQISSLEISDDLEERRDTICQEEGYFANFSFNHELKYLYDAAVEEDSDSDGYENQSKFKFISRRETLVQTFQQPSLFKQTEIRRQDSNNLSDSQQIRLKNNSHNSNGQNSYINNNNNQSMMSNSQNSQKIKNLKQQKKKSTGSFSGVNQVTLIPNQPYEESRRQYSVEFKQDQLLMYQSYQESDNQSSVLKIQKKQSFDIINNDINQNIQQQKIKKYSTQINEDIPEAYRQSEETADQ